MSDPAAKEAAVRRLKTNFGNNIDKDVLESVLEICNNDVNAAIAFLQADAGGYAFDPTQENKVPSDYPGQQKYVGYVNNSEKSDDEGSLEKTIKNLFVQETGSTLQAHFDAQTNHYNTYVAVVLVLSKFHVEMTKSAKSRMLAAAWARHDEPLAKFILAQEERPNLPQVLGALNLLDAPRKTRAIERRITALQAQGKAKPKTYGKLRAAINDLAREAHIGSVSGALSKKIRKWVKGIPASDLTFYALNLPKQPWKDLADLIHLNPKTDFQCPFLEIAFEDKPAPGSMIAECTSLTADNCAALSKKWKVPYSYLRVQVKPLPADAKAAVAEYASLETLIWYHEELQCETVNKTIAERLANGEEPKFGYGKLMERLLYLRKEGVSFYQYLEPIADRRMRALRLSLESPVSVLGDASFSMDVAIRCATIIGSVLTLLTHAELRFFHAQCFAPHVQPRTVAEALEVATKTKADGLTAPACAIADYYNSKKVVKFFIVVTDEIENQKFEGQYFPDLFMKYYKEVYPAKIVFVSFLSNPSEKGRMVQAMSNMGIEPIQFRLDANRPDLQKLDSLLGLLATESTSFTSQVQRIAAEVAESGLVGALAAYNSREPMEISESISTPGPAPKSTTTESNLNAEVSNLAISEFVMMERENAEQRAAAKSAEKSNVPEQEKLCVICEEKRADMALLECGHMVLCHTCSPAVVERNACPLCRAPIIRAVRIYQNA